MIVALISSTRLKPVLHDASNVGSNVCLPMLAKRWNEGWMQCCSYTMRPTFVPTFAFKRWSNIGMKSRCSAAHIWCATFMFILKKFIVTTGERKMDDDTIAVAATVIVLSCTKLLLVQNQKKRRARRWWMLSLNKSRQR